MSEHVKEVSEKDFEAEVLKSDLPVVVDFWEPWLCGPCLAAAPHFEEFAKKYVGEAKFVKVCSDDAGELLNSIVSLVFQHFYF